MSQQDNIALVQRGYENFLKGDIPALLDLCADDIEWELASVENMPFSGKRRGRAQVAEFFRLLGELQEALQFEPGKFVAQGNTVVVLGHYAWSVKPTGARFESDWAHVFTIRDGKLARFREYADTKAAAAAYQPPAAPGVQRVTPAQADQRTLH